MKIHLVGLSHQTTPIAIREQVYVSPSKLGGLLQRLQAFKGITEVAVLSTCNRTELYTVCEHEQQALDCCCELRPAGTADLQPYLYTMREEEAARHLFRVTAGLESLALGEEQIQGQVAVALEIAQKNGAIGKQLNGMFQQALAVGKRIRTETAIGGGSAALSRIAVDLVTASLPDVSTLTVLLIGAGDIAEATARQLCERHAHRVFVTNRTHARAVALAAQFAGHAVSFADRGQLLAECDVVISSTAAPHYVVSLENVSQTLLQRDQRSILMIDLALPRDIDPRVGELPGVHIVNLDDLRSVSQAYRQHRLRELHDAEAILTEEVARWSIRRAGLDLAPIIKALHARFEAIRQQELATAEKQLDKLDPHQRQMVEGLTRTLVKHLLHDPTVKLKHLSAKRGDALSSAVLSEIFDLSTGGEEGA